MKRFTLIAVALGCLVFAACTTGQDSKIKNQIRVTLDNQDLKEVGVAVEGGVVTLEGKVRSDFDRVEAEHTARSVEGVKDVINRIEREEPAESASISPADRYDNSSDGWITFKTKMSLFADKRTSGYETEVTTTDGRVVLTGKVEDSTAKTAATEVAKSIDGVKGVENDLQVVPEAKREIVNEKDDVISDNVKAALSPIQNDATNLEADVNAGVVTLRGKAQDRSSLSSAVRSTRQVPGVKAVKTTLVEIQEAETPRQAASDYRK